MMFWKYIVHKFNSSQNITLIGNLLNIIHYRIMILTFEARIESDFIPRKLAVYTWEFLSIIWKAFFF